MYQFAISSKTRLQCLLLSAAIHTLIYVSALEFGLEDGLIIPGFWVRIPEGPPGFQRVRQFVWPVFFFMALVFTCNLHACSLPGALGRPPAMPPSRPCGTPKSPPSESFSKILLASAGEFPYSTSSHGGVAQLGERLTGSQEVRGSIPLVSTRALNEAPTQVGAFFHIGTQGQRRHHDPPGRQDRKKLRRARPL